MKKLIIILMFSSLFAERQVKSQEILDKINNRISIKYEDIIVDGNLNFTSMYDNNTVVPTADKTMLEKALNIFINIDVKENKEITSNIEVPIEFLNYSMPSKDKRKLAAIMFADVVGYSRMMASNEERTLELLKDFENICSPIISDNEGEIIKRF